MSEFEWIEIKRTKGEESSMYEWLGSTYDGSSSRYASVFAGRERGGSAKRKNKIVLRQLAHRKRETGERKRTEPRKGVSLASVGKRQPGRAA